MMLFTAAFRRLGIALLAALAGAAMAAELDVMPVGVRLATPSAREALAVGNRGHDAVVIEVEIYRWTQSEGADVYTQTDELVVNPPLFTLPPGQTQVLRVGLRRPQPVEQEVAYRIFLREVPTAEVGGRSGLQVLLRLGLPVFVAPPESAVRLRWQARPAADGKLVVEAVNEGNVHVQLSQLQLQDAGAAIGTPALALNAYLLAGQGGRWTLNPGRPLPAGARVVATTDRGRQDVPVAVPKP